jgi:hypothetical protein
MGMFNAAPPRLPSAPMEYDRPYMDQLLNVLYLYFQRQNGVQKISMAQLNIDLATLPTEADLADLRLGDVYRDTTADNALKVKV